MLSERLVHPDVRTLLMSGEPFQFAHLIKFERPSRPEDKTGVVSTSAYKYTYLTDASRNVSFDDLSKDQLGNNNGTQTYIANKVLKVTGVPESIEAKASSFTVTLDGNGLGAIITGNVTITAVSGGVYWDIQWPTNTPVIEQGFREGDKVLLSGAQSGSFNIDSFRENNVTRVKKLEDTLTAGSGSLTMSLLSEEIKSILIDKFGADYASFINREVYIYRAYFQDGQLVGQTPDNGVTGPVLMFKGIIANVDFEEADDGIKVQWGLTSHWGDFAQVKGRITSDDFHRALDENGVPQPYSAIKVAYAFDKGFMHAETSLNLLADYSVQVEKQSVKAKSGFLGLGIGAKVKVKKYYETEIHHSALDFQLTARSIPVIYGVRNVESIPIFADTLLNDASSVYVAHVLCEGEIGGIFDVLAEGKSMICANQSDYDVRHAQNEEETVDVICSGRADRGDVLVGTDSISNTNQLFYEPVTNIQDLALNPYTHNYSYSYRVNFNLYNEPTSFAASNLSGGLTHGKSLKLTSKQTITLDFFGGKEDQVASPALVAIAAANNFKVQNDYWTNVGGAVEYWGPNHRLLDTAYVVANYKIEEGETTIPTLEFVVRGKILECYNYDFSYSHDIKAASESANNFKLGQIVTLKRSDNDAILVSNVQIIDKWTLVKADGTPDIRFRWSTPPALLLDSNGVPAITKFYMTDGTNKWTMITYNYELDSGTITTELSGDITTSPDPSGGTIVTTPPGAPINDVPLPGISIDDGNTVTMPISRQNNENLRTVYL